MRSRTLVWAVVLVTLSGCASNPPAPTASGPKFPSYPYPAIPANLVTAPDLRQRHSATWNRFQGGDVGGAGKDFENLVKAAPNFYPAMAAYGFVALARRDFKDAFNRFKIVLGRNDRYIPGLIGLAEAQLGSNDEPGAVSTMQRVLSLDSRQEGVRTRLDLIKFRQVQAFIDAARKARNARKYDEARAAFGRALDLSPSSTAVLRELIQVEITAGAWDDAEIHGRRVVQLEPNEAAAHAELGVLLEARNKFREAETAYSRAAAIEARPEWRSKAAALRAKADLAAAPAEFGDLAKAAAVTRGQTAALIGIRLGALIDRAPRRPATVATDIRTHWAAPWILRVTQAGVMEIYENHTFQPSATVRRGDLAQIVSTLLALPMAAPREDLNRWRAARPRFSDLAQGHVFYRAAALAVASGAMTVDAGRFDVTGAASGPDLSAALARVDEIRSRSAR